MYKSYRMKQEHKAAAPHTHGVGLASVLFNKGSQKINFMKHRPDPPPAPPHKPNNAFSVSSLYLAANMPVRGQNAQRLWGRRRLEALDVDLDAVEPSSGDANAGAARRLLKLSKKYKKKMKGYKKWRQKNRDVKAGLMDRDPRWLAKHQFDQGNREREVASKLAVGEVVDHPVLSKEDYRAHKHLGLPKDVGKTALEHKNEDTHKWMAEKVEAEKEVNKRLSEILDRRGVGVVSPPPPPSPPPTPPTPPPTPPMPPADKDSPEYDPTQDALSSTPSPPPAPSPPPSPPPPPPPPQLPLKCEGRAPRTVREKHQLVNEKELAHEAAGGNALVEAHGDCEVWRMVKDVHLGLAEMEKKRDGGVEKVDLEKKEEQIQEEAQKIEEEEKNLVAEEAAVKAAERDAPAEERAKLEKVEAKLEAEEAKLKDEEAKVAEEATELAEEVMEKKDEKEEEEKAEEKAELRREEADLEKKEEQIEEEAQKIQQEEEAIKREEEAVKAAEKDAPAEERAKLQQVEAKLEAQETKLNAEEAKVAEEATEVAEKAKEIIIAEEEAAA